MFRALRTPRRTSTTTQPASSSKTTSRKSKRKRRSVSGFDQYQRLEQRLPLTTFIVNTLADGPVDDPVDGLVSLREAIEAANTNSIIGDAPAGEVSGDRIIFADGLYSNNVLAIELTQGEYVVTDDLVIKGARINAQDTSRVFTVSTGERFNLRESTMINGFADNGGLILIEDGGDVVLYHNFLVSSQATNNGGAVYSLSSNLITIGGEISDNHAAAFGGAITLSDGGKARLLETVFRDNEARAGGAVAAGGDAQLVSNSTFTGNQAGLEGPGGAIYLVQSATANIFGGQFFSNESTDASTLGSPGGAGGAIFSSGSGLFITDTFFASNKAESGGAISVTHSELVLKNVEFDNNRSTSSGGALSLVDAGDSYVINSTFSNNSSSSGGAIWVSDRSDTETVSGVFVLRGSTISDNFVADGRGGGVAVNDVVARFIDSTISENLASRGGGVSATGGSALFLRTSLFHNVTRSTGGGLFSNGEIQMIDSSLSFNTVVMTDDSLGGRGGGAYFMGDAYRRLFMTTVHSNSSPVGGGVYVDGGVVAAIDSNFTSNWARNSGGGVFVGEPARFNAVRSTFGNNLSQQGGAIYALGFVNVDAGTFSSNHAETWGGAIVVESEGRLFVGATDFLDNTSRGDGAAIVAHGFTTSLVSDSNFISNRSTNDPTFEGVILVGPNVSFHRVLDSAFSN